MPAIELSLEDLVRWLREAYFAVDGVWFLTLEERLGLEQTVEIDCGGMEKSRRGPG